jgi:hypothetical protein
MCLAEGRDERATALWATHGDHSSMAAKNDSEHHILLHGL